MDNRVTKYVKWNQAFIEYFFSGNAGEEVFLYITKNILNAIGEKHGLGNYNDFLSVVLIKPEERSTFLYELKKLYVGYGVSGSSDSNLLNYATFFTKAPLNGKVKVAYLNFAVLAVFLASEAFSSDDRAIGNFLSRYLVNNAGDKNQSRNGLEILFCSLNKEFPEFRNYNLTKDRYVGLLKYQLVLSGNQIERFNESLYRIRFCFDEYENYEDVVYKLRDYVDDDLKEILHTSLSSEAHKKRIVNLLQTFDPEEYELSHDTNNQHIVGELKFAINFGDVSNKLVLLTDICDADLSDGEIKIRPSNRSRIGRFNSCHVLINGSDIISYGEYCLRNPNFTIKTDKISDIILFRRYNDEYYIQTRDLTSDETYVLVRDCKKSINKWETTFKTYAVSSCELECQDEINELFGPGWKLFVVSSFLVPDGNRHLKNCPAVSKISMRGGILIPSKVNVFLANALPYFEFPLEISKDCLTLCINIDGKLKEIGSDYELYIVQNNKLVIDIINSTYFNEISNMLDISIEYDSDDYKANEHFSISICGQKVSYKDVSFCCFDKWGKMTDKKDSHYIQGYYFSNLEKVENHLLGYTQRCNDLQPLYRDSSLDDFYFINLLSSIAYFKDSLDLTRIQLEKCLRYSSHRMGVDDTSDNKFIWRLKDLLVGQLFLTPKDENFNKYQILPPAFIKIPPEVLSNEKYRYLLVGCYTRRFLTILINYCHEHDIKIFRKERRADSNNPSLLLLPPSIIISPGFSPSEFIKETKEFCEIENNRLIDGLLAFSPSVDDYLDLWTERIASDMFNVELEDVYTVSYPRIRRGKSNHSYQAPLFIEEKENNFLMCKLRNYAWISLCVKYLRKRPFIMVTASKEICFPLDISLPYPYQRILHLLNLGPAKVIKAFICNNILTDDTLYSQLKCYTPSVVAEKSVEVKKLLGLLTGYESDIDNPYVVKSSNHLSFTMELWRRKAKFGNLPKNCLILKKGSEVLAFSTSKEVYVKKENAYVRVEGSPNQIMSILIMSDRKIGTWAQIGINFIGDSKPLPALDNYNREVIEIR